METIRIIPEMQGFTTLKLLSEKKAVCVCKYKRYG